MAGAQLVLVEPAVGGSVDEVWEERLSGAAPGPELAEVIERAALVAIGWDSPRLRIAVCAAARRQVAHYSATSLQHLAGATDALREQNVPVQFSVGDEDGTLRYSAAEAGAALGLAPQTARAEVELAERLSNRPATMAALASGAIDLPRARVIAEELCETGTCLDWPRMAELEVQVVAYAQAHTTAALRKKVRSMMAAADPAAAQEAHQERAARRCVRIRPEGDGMASLTWIDTAPKIRAAQGRLSVLAEAALAEADGPRGLESARADVLNDLIGADPETLLEPLGPSVATDLSVELVVHVPLAALTEAGAGGELEGLEWIGAEQARKLAAVARTARIQVTDERGRCLHASRSFRYTPPAALARTVRAAHRTCRFPGCRRRATACDLDHLVEYPAGPTCACNLHPLCRGHHNLKTHGGWKVRLGEPDDPLGPRIWTSPTGRTSTDHPEDPPF